MTTNDREILKLLEDGGDDTREMKVRGVYDFSADIGWSPSDGEYELSFNCCIAVGTDLSQLSARLGEVLPMIADHLVSRVSDAEVRRKLEGRS